MTLLKVMDGGVCDSDTHCSLFVVHLTSPCILSYVCDTSSSPGVVTASKRVSDHPCQGWQWYWGGGGGVEGIWWWWSGVCLCNNTVVGQWLLMEHTGHTLLLISISLSGWQMNLFTPALCPLLYSVHVMVGSDISRTPVSISIPPPSLSHRVMIICCCCCCWPHPWC